MLFTGVTDFDLHSVINMTGFEPKLTIVTMPWLFQNGYQSVDEILFNGEGGKRIRELVEAKGAHVLGMGENGFRQITNNVRPITSVADMQRLKIRTPPITMYVDLFKLFGADPTVMSYSEVFTALQQGTIDGQENPLDTIRSGKIQEVQKYISIWNYSYDPIVLSVSTKAWARIPDEDKKIFEEAGDAAMKAQVQASRAMDAEILKLFESHMQITQLTPEQSAEFQKAAAPIYEQYKDKMGVDLFAAFGYTFK
jgi:tripartite ATP-independent transporter DctP family solute receptor